MKDCKFCNKKFDTEESLSQHIRDKHETSDNKAEYQEKNKKKTKRYIILAILVVAVIIISYTFYVRSLMPGIYDDFAKCLSEKGVVIYGNDFCSYTNQQLNGFGKSEKYLKYVKCAENKELCDSKGVKVTPTWEIEGKMYEQVQSFDKLSTLSGCEI